MCLMEKIPVLDKLFSGMSCSVAGQSSILMHQQQILNTSPWGFPVVQVVKKNKITCLLMQGMEAGDMSLIPGSGRSPGGGRGNPLQYSCLENPMDREAWKTTVHGVTKSWTQLNAHTRAYTHTHTHTHTHTPQSLKPFQWISEFFPFQTTDLNKTDFSSDI